jgi:hypothetical protein
VLYSILTFLGMVCLATKAYLRKVFVSNLAYFKKALTRQNQMVAKSDNIGYIIMYKLSIILLFWILPDRGIKDGKDENKKYWFDHFPDGGLVVERLWFNINTHGNA